MIVVLSHDTEIKVAVIHLSTYFKYIATNDVDGVAAPYSTSTCSHTSQGHIFHRKKSLWFIIWLSNDTGKNVALHMVAINHPASYVPLTASNAVNGDTRLFIWALCSLTTLGSVDDPPWWRVDLEMSYMISGIKIYNRGRICKLIHLPLTPNILGKGSGSIQLKWLYGRFGSIWMSNPSKGKWVD